MGAGDQVEERQSPGQRSEPPRGRSSELVLVPAPLLTAPPAPLARHRTVHGGVIIVKTPPLRFERSGTARTRVRATGRGKKIKARNYLSPLSLLQVIGALNESCSVSAVFFIFLFFPPASKLFRKDGGRE